ncbi:MAG TPA: hypothetical protein VFE18_15945 [Phenylobacterium sp.]|uniref:hypothetical protein n=1 Tax=Phenylobacterium sp. TaxID=1871053 RepID=UPI002D577B5C|nr:hypothetical protein [Phenylobacterium sp.]HZZ69664.1 hypothetical protein [Phenylobacterium sp.]
MTLVTWPIVAPVLSFTDMPEPTWAPAEALAAVLVLEPVGAAPLGAGGATPGSGLGAVALGELELGVGGLVVEGAVVAGALVDGAVVVGGVALVVGGDAGCAPGWLAGAPELDWAKPGPAMARAAAMAA